MKRVYNDIIIRPTMRGWHVRVGCRELVYSESEELDMVKDLKEYIEDPDKKQLEMDKVWEPQQPSLTRAAGQARADAENPF